MMRKSLTLLALLAALGLGCTGMGEKGANKDKDRPVPADVKK